MPEPAVNTSFTLDNLREIMRACAGIDESVDLDSDIGSRTFEDLGYDSLAVLEMTAKIQNMLGVVIIDDAAKKLTTPQSLADYVAVQLTGHQAPISRLGLFRYQLASTGQRPVRAAGAGRRGENRGIESE